MGAIMKTIFITSAISFASGIIITIFCFNYFDKPEKIEIVKIEKPVQNIVQREYIKIPCNDVYDLYHYDHDLMKIEYKIIDNNVMRVDWQLYQRKGHQDVELNYNCNQTRNWKMYIGIGAIGLTAGGYLAYRMAKK